MVEKGREEGELDASFYSCHRPSKSQTADGKGTVKCSRARSGVNMADSDIHSVYIEWPPHTSYNKADRYDI